MDESYTRKFYEEELRGLSRRLFLRRMAGVAVVAGSSGSILAACGSGAETSTSADTGEIGGTLSFLGIEGEDGKAVASSFLAENDVKLKVAFVGDQDTMLTKLRTGGTRTADFISLNKDWAYREIELGYVRPLDLERLPNFEGLFAGLKDAPWVAKDGEVYGIPVIWGDGPCVYDPAVWSSGPPPRYTDLADSKFAKSLTTIDDPYANQWLVAKSLGYGEDGQHNRVTQAEMDDVRDVWKEIKANVVSFAPSFGDITDLMVRGEASMAIGNWAAVVAFAKEKGKTLDFANPSEDGTYYWGDSYYLTSQGPNVATAYAYLDYLSSADSNAEMANTLQSGCTIADSLEMLPAKSISAGYPYEQVKSELQGDFVQSTIPPDEPEGDIIGKESWVKSWEEIKTS